MPLSWTASRRTTDSFDSRFYAVGGMKRGMMPSMGEPTRAMLGRLARLIPVRRSAQMSATVSCRVEQPSTASPASVYDALMGFERWSDWMPTVSAASWARRGAPDTGVGGIRRVRVGPCVTHDRIVEGTKPTHHAYSVELPWWVPQRDFRGDVRIEDRTSGCLIIWTATCTPRLPGLRKLMEFNLHATYKRIAAALAREAERTAIR